MADDNSVVIKFSAVTDDALAGIEHVHEYLSDLAEPLTGLVGELEDAGAAAQWAALQAQGLGAQLKLVQDNFAVRKMLLGEEAKQFQITQDQKFELLEEETKKELEAERALIAEKIKLSSQEGKEKSVLYDRLVVLAAKQSTEMTRLEQQAMAVRQAMWNSYLSTVTSAFNSQLRGLLEGTTNWHAAMKKMLEDLTIKFIEAVEQMAVKWAAGELAKTAATTTGAAARAATEQGAASAGLLANAAAAVKAIMTDAAQTFAGVFAFLAPTMGPAAAGPAAAAEASVSAAAIFDVGTDYVVRGGLALIHPGETIIPAARGSGPFTGANISPQVHAPVSINISALDSQSVSRFFNDNSTHLLRAINDAVKRGAHLGLRG